MPQPRKPAAARSKAAAARAEKTAGRTISKYGITLALPAKMPFNILRPLREDDVLGAVEVILGADEFQKVWDANLEFEQGRELLDAIIADYGIGQGE